MDLNLGPCTPSCFPNECDLTIKPVSSDPITLRVEIVAQCPITMNENGDNLNGIDWEGDSTAIAMMEGAARLTTPDGSVGYAFHERGIRRSALPKP